MFDHIAGRASGDAGQRVLRDGLAGWQRAEGVIVRQQRMHAINRNELFGHRERRGVMFLFGFANARPVVIHS